MKPEEFTKQLHALQLRFWKEAQFIILEELPFYLKVRIVIKENIFIEVRNNVRNTKTSYSLIKNGNRIAGFDNLDGWHLHPIEDPKLHKKIKEPSLTAVFQYFKNAVQ